jgi:acyl-coenzyme A thioesterase PaaI-like protein
MSSTLELYRKITRLPLGHWIFSRSVCFVAPYFSTIHPRFVELRPGYAEVLMKKRRKVQNHFSTVHAIAMCNLCELAGGTMTEVSVPDTMRWIPKGMTVEYLQKARTDLRGIAEGADIDWETPGEKQVPVSVRDTNGTEVMRAVITMLVSKKQGDVGDPPT